MPEIRSAAFAAQYVEANDHARLSSGYAGGSTTIGKEKRNGLLRLTTEAQWRRQMGG